MLLGSVEGLSRRTWKALSGQTLGYACGAGWVGLEGVCGPPWPPVSRSRQARLLEAAGETPWHRHGGRFWVHRVPPPGVGLVTPLVGSLSCPVSLGHTRWGAPSLCRHHSGPCHVRAHKADKEPPSTHSSVHNLTLSRNLPREMKIRPHKNLSPKVHGLLVHDCHRWRETRCPQWVSG